MIINTTELEQSNVCNPSCQIKCSQLFTDISTDVVGLIRGSLIQTEKRIEHLKCYAEPMQLYQTSRDKTTPLTELLCIAIAERRG